MFVRYCDYCHAEGAFTRSRFCGRDYEKDVCPACFREIENQVIDLLNRFQVAKAPK